MLWIVATVVFAVIVAVAIFLRRSDTPETLPARRDERGGFLDEARLSRTGTTAILIGIPVLWAAWTLFASVHLIEAGHVGVIYTFGDVTGQVGAGFQTTAPWQSVRVASTQVQRETFPKIDSFSEETQDVFITATVNYEVSPNAIQELYRNVGPSWFDRLVESRVLQIFKDTTVRYKSVEIAPAREEIRRAVRDRLREELQGFSIDVVDLLIDNIDFRPEFKEAIERKQIATQDAQTAQNRVAEARFKADQQVETAKGEAQSVLVRAQAQARANRLLSQSLTERVVRYEAVQKLAPNVQTILLPSDAGFLLPQLLQPPKNTTP
ncbi:MAG TPA: SPFH domain-containing protein [Gaiella sp.]|jgi:regulator of protease activity HflC (stomatin/prohibitin superfamily)